MKWKKLSGQDDFIIVQKTMKLEINVSSMLSFLPTKDI